MLGIQKHLNNPFRVAESAQSIEIWRFTKLKDAPNQEVGLLFALSKIELGATRSGKILVELGGSALGLEKLRTRAHLADILLVRTMLILMSNGVVNLILARRPAEVYRLFEKVEFAEVLSAEMIERTIAATEARRPRTCCRFS